MIVMASTAVPAGGFTFQLLSERDGREYLAVQCRALGHSRCGPAMPGLADRAPRVMGAFDRNGLLSAMAGMLPMTVRIGGCEVSGHGVLDVAVDLLHRGRGASPALIARILADAHENGSAVSVAHPSAPALYRGLGYEAVACLELRRLNPTVVEGATADSGVRLRDGVGEEVLESLSRHLEGACSPAPPAVDGVRDVVLDRDGEAVGMLRLERLAGRVVVHLLRVADAGAWTTALVVLRAEAAQEAGESCIEVWGGGDDDLALWHPGRLRVRECSMPMLRVVDVVRALEERGWPADVAERWCFNIADPLIPANTGAWVLELEGGRAHVSASTTRGFPVSLPRLAQLVAGVLPAGDETVPADLARASALRPWAGIFEF